MNWTMRVKAGTMRRAKGEMTKIRPCTKVVGPIVQDDNCTKRVWGVAISSRLWGVGYGQGTCSSTITLSKSEYNKFLSIFQPLFL